MTNEINIARPNYDTPCMVCEQVPTVDIIRGGICVLHTEMCGVCTWGEVDCLDPDNW